MCLFYLSLQFGIAIFLIIGMLAANKQFDFLINFNLGYQDKNVISVEIPRFDEGRLERFETALKSIPGIQVFAANSGYNGTDFHYNEQRVKTRHIRVTDQFIPALGIELTQGRNFDPELGSDIENTAIINETLAKALGLTNPIGVQIPFDYGKFNNPTIIGVVKDFHFNSPKYQQKPLIMYQSPQYALQNVLIKLDNLQNTDAVYQIEKAWKVEYGPFPIELTWLSDYNDDQMAVEKSVKKIATTGSLIAVFLAALGLMSMVGTHINQRMKEISIRKISGASALDLYLQYSRKFGIWIVSGFLLGCAPAYYFVSEWLSNYPSKIDLSWELGLIALGVCTLVFVVTMILQMTKVVRANPVVFLKDE